MRFTKVIALWSINFVMIGFIYAYNPKDSIGQKIIAGKRCIIYKIQEGNTISALAQKYGTTLNAIKEVNPGINLDKLTIGQIVNIPRGVSTPSNTVTTHTNPTQPMYYTVKPGDTPSTIAQKHGISLQKLYAWNGFNKTPVLQIGQKLIIGYSNTNNSTQHTTNNPSHSNQTDITPSNNTFENPNPQVKVVAQDEIGKKDAVNEVFVKPYQKKTETGKAIITDSLLKSDSFGAIHKDLKIGTIITIINPTNKKSVYARIEANEPNLTYLLRVTPAIAEMLRTSDKEFNVEIKYVQ
ncbi:MAG: LysM peptidoglycan-binding domain-containing protein [Bacteroidia bacterium]|nr:LysM peptidoglycan-binding domain-containing protein [Bacteroidia bacterium]MDW8347305.1 LysM peptidoglycan-binding domain-containing protein [Bacteroidia bacterium]